MMVVEICCVVELLGNSATMFIIVLFVFSTDSKSNFILTVIISVENVFRPR